MSPGRVLRLDQIIEGAGATVEARVGADGSVAYAWFAMDGMPRIEPLLLGRPVAAIPGIVERLCGICPVAHHLAGVRAFEALVGAPPLTPTAEAVRRLLLLGSVLQTHAQALTAVDANRARAVGAFAARVVAAAGADSHFPRCAVPGGVLTPLPVIRRDELVGQVGPALESAIALVRLIEDGAGGEAPTYGGHDVSLVDAAGALDLYGDRVRAVAADGSVTVEGAGPGEWAELVSEARPGSPAPRPYLRALGSGAGAYRVGPVAQLRAVRCLGTPLAEEARQRWAGARGDAAWARAVVTLHVVEAIEELVGRPELIVGAVLTPLDAQDPTAGRHASGWVDGARGLLVHTYRTEGAGRLSAATITTPTAQNEGWLAELLSAAVRGASLDTPDAPVPGHLRGQFEAAIREADPCLPCTSAPPGRMQVRLQLRDSDETPVGSWLLEGAPWISDAASDVAREGR